MRNLRVSLAVLGLVIGACDRGEPDPAPRASQKKAGTSESKGGTDADAKEAGEPGKAGGETPTFAFALPAGLFEEPKVPADNPMSPDKVALGHALFMDKRLSGDGSRSCYSCHQNELGNADGRTVALGPGDKPLTRNTPTIWNVAYHAELYWDGRAPSLEKQAIGAWKGGNMAAGDDLAPKAAEIGALPEYRPQFEKVFGLATDAPVTPEHVAMALSAYERTLLCGDTAYDKNTLDEAAQRGMELFKGKGSCTTCHAGDNLTDGKYHNVGIGFDAGGKPGEDKGRGKISEKTEEEFRFRTPTLRNVGKTAPYFHDGSVATLEEAVKYMASGGNPKVQGLDENLVDRKLSDGELADLVMFLRVLDCPGQLEVIGDQKVPGIPG